MNTAKASKIHPQTITIHTSRMHIEKITHTANHAHNPYQGRYDFDALVQAHPPLQQYLTKNPKGDTTITFGNADAVQCLNHALLCLHYGVSFWEIPKGRLCPPIPSRADYVYHLADVLKKNKKTSTKQSTAETSQPIHALDIGTGANMIYPIIACNGLGWQVTATDIDDISLTNARLICSKNSTLNTAVTVRKQNNSKHIFKGVIMADDYFDITLCNPPFHASEQDMIQANTRKKQNLAISHKKRNPHAKTQKPPRKNELNFGGHDNELWCDGGEKAFLRTMAQESKQFAKQVGWFSSLVSKKENVDPLLSLLEKNGASHVKVIQMQHGQKKSRIVAWKFA